MTKYLFLILLLAFETTHAGGFGDFGDKVGGVVNSGVNTVKKTTGQITDVIKPSIQNSGTQLNQTGREIQQWGQNTGNTIGTVIQNGGTATQDSYERMRRQSQQEIQRINDDVQKASALMQKQELEARRRNAATNFNNIPNGLENYRNQIQGGAQSYWNNAQQGVRTFRNQVPQGGNYDRQVNRNLRNRIQEINQAAEIANNQRLEATRQLQGQMEEYGRQREDSTRKLQSAFEAAQRAQSRLGSGMAPGTGGRLGEQLRQFGTSAVNAPRRAIQEGATAVRTQIETLDDEVDDRIEPTVGAGDQLREQLKRYGTRAATVSKSSAEAGVARLGTQVKNLEQEVEEEAESIGEDAASDLRTLDPKEIFNWVQQSLREEISDQLSKNGATLNKDTGELDLQNTRMGQRLSEWVNDFAQGNRGEGRVDTFTYNINDKTLLVRLYARHCHSWGKRSSAPDVYSVEQRATFRYDFQAKSGEFDVDPGRLSTRFSSKTLQQLKDGDLVSAAESAYPKGIDAVVDIERTDKYSESVSEYYSKYGSANVYFASKDFVDWAGPSKTLGKYVANGVLTAGASVYPQIMADLKQRARQEIPRLTKWLQQRGIDNGVAVAEGLLTGRPPEWPFLKFEIIPVRYSAQEELRKNPLDVQAASLRRHDDHLAFVIIWVGGSDKVSRQYGQTEN